jgi:hypothetical protein
MADTVLQSFVVKLRYDMDEATHKKFREGISGGIAQLNSFRLAVLGAVVGVEELVRRTTSGFASLSYSARSANVSAQQMEEFRAALAGAGHAAEQAGPVLNDLFSRLRDPEGRAKIKAFVTDGKEVTSGFEVMMDAAAKYKKALVESNYNEQSQHMTETVLKLRDAIGQANLDIARDMVKNEKQVKESVEFTDKLYKEIADKAHVRIEDVYKNSQDIEHHFWELGQTFRAVFGEFLGSEPVAKAIKLIADNIKEIFLSDETQKTIGRLLHDFGEWLKNPDAAKQIADGIKEIGSAFVAFGNAIATVIEHLKWMEEHKKTTGTVLGAVAGFAVAGPAGILPGAAAGFAAGAYAGADPAGEYNKQQKEYEEGKKAGSDTRTPEEFQKDFEVQQGLRNYQHGGIVNANLHHGEMVLPTNISMGLQSLFAGGAGSFVETLRRMLQSFLSWFSGDTSYRPQVELGNDTLDEMGKITETGGKSRSQRPDTGAGGAGGAGGRGGGGEGGVGGGSIGHYTGQKGERAEEWRRSGRDPKEVAQFIREEAARQGIDPMIALKVARSEGLGNPVATVPSEQSYSAFQLNMARGAVGDQMLRQTGIDPSKPENEKAAIAFALRWVRLHGWGAWSGARGQHIYGQAGVLGGGYQPDYKSFATGAIGGKPPTAVAGGSPMEKGAAAAAAAGAAAQNTISAMFGDSIALGTAKALGVEGIGQGGQTPETIYNMTRGRFKEFANKTVGLAFGSNQKTGGGGVLNERQIGYMGKMIEELQAAHANVILEGVGYGAPRGVQEQLHQLAQKYHLPLTGLLPHSEARGGKGPAVHPYHFPDYRNFDYGDAAKELDKAAKSIKLGADKQAAAAASAEKAAKQPPRVVQNVHNHVYASHVHEKQMKYTTDRQLANFIGNNRRYMA